MVIPSCSPKKKKKKSGTVSLFLLESSDFLALAHLLQMLLLWSSSSTKLSASLTSTWEIREHDGPQDKASLEEIFYVQLIDELAWLKSKYQPSCGQDLLASWKFWVLWFSISAKPSPLSSFGFLVMLAFSLSTQNSTYMLWTGYESTCGLQNQITGLVFSSVSYFCSSRG